MSTEDIKCAQKKKINKTLWSWDKLQLSIIQWQKLIQNNNNNNNNNNKKTEK